MPSIASIIQQIRLFVCVEAESLCVTAESLILRVKCIKHAKTVGEGLEKHHYLYVKKNHGCLVTW